jgi:hypothetical protein
LEQIFLDPFGTEIHICEPDWLIAAHLSLAEKFNLCTANETSIDTSLQIKHLKWS